MTKEYRLVGYSIKTKKVEVKPLDVRTSKLAPGQDVFIYRPTKSKIVSGRTGNVIGTRDRVLARGVLVNSIPAKGSVEVKVKCQAVGSIVKSTTKSLQQKLVVSISEARKTVKKSGDSSSKRGSKGSILIKPFR